MNFKFLPQLPRDFTGQAVLISGQKSLQYKRIEYLILNDDDLGTLVFEIRYDGHSSSFKKMVIIGNVMAVGHEEKFYLHDLALKEELLILTIHWYVSEIYVNNDLLYVADAQCLYCINQRGNILWKTSELGIDGVIINSFDNGIIQGSGEWDPPGGWKDFVLKESTGESVSHHQG